MKIVAFLQNMWVTEPEKVRRMIERDATGKLRARLIKYSLFAGCKTGRVLTEVFGKDLCDHIVWEEASPVIAGNPRDYFPPDPAHVVSVLDANKPEVVIGFTARGKRVLHALCHERCLFIASVHPAARSPGILDELVRTRDVLVAHEQLCSMQAELLAYQTAPEE